MNVNKRIQVNSRDVIDKFSNYLKATYSYKELKDTQQVRPNYYALKYDRDFDEQLLNLYELGLTRIKKMTSKKRFTGKDIQLVQDSYEKIINYSVRKISIMAGKSDDTSKNDAL